MRISALIMIPALVLSSARADELTPADREALLQKLESIRDDANGKVEARFRAAIAAYNAAASSNDAATELYLKCIEKLNFEDQDKKASDFREWKKKEDDKLTDPGLGLALRLQINWLILTLRAASPEADRTQLLHSVQEIVDVIVREASMLKNQRQILSQGVTSSIFAKAYEIQNVNVESWAMSPGEIGEIYDSILLPPLRRPERLDALRSAWIRRIQQEMIIRQSWSNEDPPVKNPKNKNGNGEAPQKWDYETFVQDRVPELQWDMEVDLFENGDQQAAALRMLAHLEKHIAHKSARRWTKELERLLGQKSASQNAAGETAP
jgi:hypothetical protein